MLRAWKLEKLPSAAKLDSLNEANLKYSSKNLFLN